MENGSEVLKMIGVGPIFTAGPIVEKKIGKICKNVGSKNGKQKTPVCSQVERILHNSRDLLSLFLPILIELELKIHAVLTFFFEKIAVFETFF